VKLQVPRNISDITPYPPGKPIEELEREYGITGSIKLASNENPFGPSPAAVAAMHDALADLHRYPDGSCYYLAQALSASLGIAPQRIVFGNGSNEVIEFLVKAFVGEGDEVVTSHPSFLMYQKFVQVRGGINHVVELHDMYHDLDEIHFVDEQNRYDTMPLIEDVGGRCGVVLLRTFSKAHGLAGLRVGFGLMCEEIAGCLHKVRQPFNVNLVAQKGACAALADVGFYQKTLQRTAAGKAYLSREVERLGCTAYPSHTNFFLIDVKGDATALYEAMLKKGVIIRSMKAYGFNDFIRVNIGTGEENDRFLGALAEALKECGYA